MNRDNLLWCTAAVVLAVVGLSSLPAAAVAAPVMYLEKDGIVVGEAEVFTARDDVGPSASDSHWGVVPDEPAAGPVVSNARGKRYIQALPDGSGGGGGPLNAPSIDYQMQIGTPGTYRLFLRWDGNSTDGTTQGQSDSIFVDVKELKDGTGGSIADWYELSEGVNGNFGSPNWDGGGGFEQNQAGASGNPITWDIATPGTYTLRVSQREDGAAVDAFVFQLDSLPDPVGFGPFPSLLASDQPVVETTLVADADSYVRLGGGQNDDHFGTDGSLFVKDSGTGSTTRKSYIRFDLSDVSTDILDAQLNLEVTTNNNGGSDPTPKEYTVNVFGLNDSAAGNDWVETDSQANVPNPGDPTPPTPLTWENAPANNTSNNGLIASDVTLLGHFLVPAINPVQTDDPVLLSFANFSSDTPDALIDFLNADTDGLVTFILARDGGSNNLGFASREDGTALAPTLRLNVAEAVPEPATVVLLAAGGLGLLLLRRRRSTGRSAL